MAFYWHARSPAVGLAAAWEAEAEGTSSGSAETAAAAVAAAAVVVVVAGTDKPVCWRTKNKTKHSCFHKHFNPLQSDII